MTAVVYDAGALVAADRHDRRLWADHRVRLEHGVLPVAPSVVVAQVSRSPRQVALRRLLRGCDVTAVDERSAHRTGRLLARSGTADVVDAVVVLEARDRAAAVVTGDRADIERLADTAEIGLTIVDVSR